MSPDAKQCARWTWACERTWVVLQLEVREVVPELPAARDIDGNAGARTRDSGKEAPCGHVERHVAVACDFANALRPCCERAVARWTRSVVRPLRMSVGTCLGGQFERVRGYMPTKQNGNLELATIKSFSMCSMKVSTLGHRAAAETDS